jgi:hypothetical protein
MLQRRRHLGVPLGADRSGRKKPVLLGEDGMIRAMDSSCGFRKSYILLLGRKNPHSSLLAA